MCVCGSITNAMQCSYSRRVTSLEPIRQEKKKEMCACNSFSLGVGGGGAAVRMSFLSLPAHVYIRSGGLFSFLSVSPTLYLDILCKAIGVYIPTRRISPLQKNNQTFLLMRY